MDEGEIKEDSSWQGLATLAFSTLRLLFPGENSVSWSKSDVRGFRIFLEEFFVVVVFFFQEKNKHVRIKSLGELRSHKERKGRRKEAIDGADSSSLAPISCCLETPKTQPFVKPVILSGFFGSNDAPLILLIFGYYFWGNVGDTPCQALCRSPARQMTTRLLSLEQTSEQSKAHNWF